jgi:sterol desaturase/sphingolipid hydroxylase (fatty acid hydroxylase superfamily)
MDLFIQYFSDILSNLFNLDGFFAAVIFAGSIALVVALVELLIDAKSSSVMQIIRHKKSALIDILFWFFHFSPLFVVVMGLSTLGIINIIKAFLHISTEAVPHLADGTLLFLILFVVYDFAGYLTHRIMHSSEITWRFHELHHSARSFNIFTVHRVHPVDSAIIKFAQTLVVLLLGASVHEVFLFTVITLLLGTAKHSNLIYGYPGIFKYLIQSPAQHWIHHSQNPLHFNKNFGEILQIWDVIFGTACNLPRDDLKNLKIGTDYTVDFHDSFIRLLVDPYKQIWSKINKTKT